MQRLSINGVWTETVEVVGRHFSAFATLAAAFAFVPALAARWLFPELLTIRLPAPGAPPTLPPGFIPAILALNFAQMLGIFAIGSISADPREGGGRVFGRVLANALPAVGKFIVALLLLAVVYLVAMVLLIMLATPILGAFGIAGVPAGVSRAGNVIVTAESAGLLAGLLLALLLWLTARLSPLVGVYLREPVNIVAGIRRAWRLSRGATLTILGIVLAFLVAGVLLEGLARGLGAALGVVGAAAGATPGIGAALFAIVAGAAGAVPFLYFAAALGVTYRQLREAEG